MNICVVGTGYVGLVAGTCFAESGNDVTCVDVLPEKVAALQRCEIPIYEPGLEELLKRNIHDRRLTFTTDLARAVAKAPIIFVAVGTPQSASGVRTVCLRNSPTKALCSRAKTL
jgi:UDPglucose 6-dehydrogenase